MKGFLKGFISVFLSACILAPCIPASAETESVSGMLNDNISWEFLYGTITVSGNGDIPSLEELGLEQYPWADYTTYEARIGYGITSIPSGAFAGLEFLVVPNTVERICTDAVSIDSGYFQGVCYSVDCVFEEASLTFADSDSSGSIRGYNGSTTEAYAKQNGMGFSDMGDKLRYNYTDGTLDYYLYDDCAYVADLAVPCTDVVIPDEVEGLPVAGIGSHALSNHPIISVIMPDTITEIREGAFESCNSLTTVELSDELVTIDKDAFAWCNSLSEVKLPDSLRTVGDSAFNYCKDMFVTSFGKSLQSIGDEAFKNCSCIEYADLPESLTYIGESAFEECGLTRIVIPSQLEVILPFTFRNCLSLEAVTLPDNIGKIYSNAFTNVPAFDTMVIPEATLVSMSEQEVSGSSNENAVIPDNITSAYSNSYYGFGTLTIGSRLREFMAAEIDPLTIKNNKDSLRDVYVSEDNPYLCAEDGVVYNKDKTAILYVAAKHEFENNIMTIPASVTEIRCIITNKTITEFVVEDGNTAFSASDGILMDSEQKTIVQYPVGRTDTSYFVPEGIEKLRQGSFCCAALKYILIPSCVKTVEKSVFWGTEPEYIIFQHTAEDELELHDEFEGYYAVSLFGESFYAQAQTDYYVHEGSVPDVKFPSNSVYLSELITGRHGNYTWSIENLTLTLSGSGDMPALNTGAYPWLKYPFTSVVFEGSDIAIAEKAFENYDLLCSADLSGVTDICLKAFSGCSMLSDITNHDAVVYADGYVLAGTEWASVPHDESGMNVLGKVLIGYAGISEEAEIPDNTAYVATGAFSGAEFSTLYVPESGVIYSSYCFTDNDSLQHLRFEGADTDLTADDFREAAKKCVELVLTDSAGAEVTGLCYTKDNSLMYLAEAVSGTPYMQGLIDEYCSSILSGAGSGISDQQLITRLYSYAMEDTVYGFTYAETEKGSLAGGEKNWEKSQHLSHDADSIIALGRGVCSSFAELVNTYVRLAESKGLTDTLVSVSCTGLNHEWNAVGLDTGTENERWYYLDLSNRTYLFGYENDIISQNPEMFNYDAALEKNDDGTYTVKLSSGEYVSIEGADMQLPDARGDVNGDGEIDLDDASDIVAVYAMEGAGMDSGFTEGQLASADANEDGEITLDDASSVLRYYAMKGVGMEPAF